MLVSGSIYFAGIIEKVGINMYFTSWLLDGSTSSSLISSTSPQQRLNIGRS